MTSQQPPATWISGTLVVYLKAHTNQRVLVTGMEPDPREARADALRVIRELAGAADDQLITRFVALDEITDLQPTD